MASLPMTNAPILKSNKPIDDAPSDLPQTPVMKTDTPSAAPKASRRRKTGSIKGSNPNWSPSRPKKRSAPARRESRRTSKLAPDLNAKTDITSMDSSGKKDYCTSDCKRGDEGNWVECSGGVCSEGGRWYHTACVGLENMNMEVLNSDITQWYCETCREHWRVGLETIGISRVWSFPKDNEDH